MWFDVLLLLKPTKELKPDEKLLVEWFLEEMERERIDINNESNT